MPDWAALCSGEGFKVRDDGIEVSFGDGRRHRVAVEDGADAYLLSAFVVKQAVVTSLPTLALDVCLRNRATDLVGFRIDRQDRLHAEAWIPKAGLDSEELQWCVRTVAAEADRLEYILTGRDVE